MNARPLGPGAAAQRLENVARRLAQSTERRDQHTAECIRVILAQRSRFLTEKFGPPRDFSRPAPSALNTSAEAVSETEET